MQPVLDRIGDGLDDLVRELVAWGALVIAAGAFPPDPYKRASG